MCGIPLGPASITTGLANIGLEGCGEKGESRWFVDKGSKG